MEPALGAGGNLTYEVVLAISDSTRAVLFTKAAVPAVRVSTPSTGPGMAVA